MNSLDPERETMHPSGARGGLQPLVQWGLQQLTYQLLPPMYDHDDPVQQRRWSERLAQAPVLTDLAAHSPGHPVWEERRLNPKLITTPAFCIGGWRDSFQWSMPRAYELMEGPKRLMMGPWGHVIPQGSPFSAINFRELALRWWDYWLRGLDNGVMEEDPVVVYIQGERPEWRSLSSWPPAMTSEVQAGPIGEEGLLLESDADTDVYEPDARIGPYSGLQCIGASSRLVLPLDQHTDDMRSYTLTTDAVREDTLLCGLPQLTCRLGAVLPEQSMVERVVLRLTDVDPAGRSTMITTCVATSLAVDDKHSFLFWPTAYRLAAGHRIRLAVSDSAFPWLVPLADPQPFRISDVSLRMPTLDESASSAVHVATVDEPLSAMTHVGGSWTIGEEPSTDGLEFKMWSRRDYVAPQGHRLSEVARSEANVTRADPRGVVYRGERSIDATMSSGDVIRVKARVHTTHGLMIADGDVTIGEVLVFSQQWRVPLAL